MKKRKTAGEMSLQAASDSYKNEETCEFISQSQRDELFKKLVERNATNLEFSMCGFVLIK